jgi:hypothetical protein
MIEKKSYNSPVVTVHGSVEEITQYSNLTNGDHPMGVGDAYS